MDRVRRAREEAEVLPEPEPEPEDEAQGIRRPEIETLTDVEAVVEPVVESTEAVVVEESAMSLPTGYQVCPVCGGLFPNVEAHVSQFHGYGNAPASAPPTPPADPELATFAARTGTNVSEWEVMAPQHFRYRGAGRRLVTIPDGWSITLSPSRQGLFSEPGRTYEGPVQYSLERGDTVYRS